VSPRFVPFGAITAVICQPLGTINMKRWPSDDSLVMKKVTVPAIGGGVGCEVGVVVGVVVGGVVGGEDGAGDTGGDGLLGDVGGRVGLVLGFDGVVAGFDVVPGEPGTTGAVTLTDSRWVFAAVPLW